MPKVQGFCIYFFDIDTQAILGAKLVSMTDTNNNQPASKKDIERLEQSTKKDIQEVKAEIKGVRANGKRTEKVLRADMLRLEERLENVEDSQKRMKTTLNKISIQLESSTSAS